jgi:hypothetical protein
MVKVGPLSGRPGLDATARDQARATALFARIVAGGYSLLEPVPDQVRKTLQVFQLVEGAIHFMRVQPDILVNQDIPETRR